MSAPQVIRKISPRHVVGNVKAIAPREDKDGNLPKDIVPLYRIFGQANGVKTGESDYGAWVALTGRFEAVVTMPDENGVASMESFAAPQCFLPEPMNTIIADELKRTDENGKREVESLEFAFDVGVKAAKTSVGYEYTCVPLMERSGADPLLALREKVAALPAPKAAQKQLAAPDKGAAKGGKK